MATYIGTSGYAHPDWRGRFYPKGLPSEQWLEYYVRHFNAVELNVTFYRLPASPTFRHWGRRVPAGFRFMLKGPRTITHDRRLADCHDELAELVERASELGDSFAGILWQLPPRLPADTDLLEHFLAEVDRAQLVLGTFRQTFEFRDASWFAEPIYDLLRAHNAAIALSDWPFQIGRQRTATAGAGSRGGGKDRRQNASTSEVLPRLLGGERVLPQLVIPATADFTYLRRYGPAARHSRPYSPHELQNLAKELRPLATERDVYVFFNNDTRAYAVKNAHQLRRYSEVIA